MNRVIGKCWRDAATLVVLCERGAAAAPACNYEVLLQTRPQRGTFRNSVVFPGGVTESADASPHWLNLLSSFGYSQEDFSALYRAGSPLPPILQDHPVQRHIQLRITAIRETFEELGILVCSRTHKEERSGLWASFITDFDVKYWQNRVSKNPEDLITLCQELKCYPDIWSLYYWSNWLTPAKSKKRFDTAFFLTAVKSKPELCVSDEVVKTEWQTPSAILNRSQELVLYPPQSYELIRLSYCPSLQQLARTAAAGSSVASPLFYHATVRAADGTVHVFPGDELYPETIDYNKYTIIDSDKTVSELRESSRVAHRIETRDSQGFLVLKNFKPNNIDMGANVIPVHVTFI